MEKWESLKIKIYPTNCRKRHVIPSLRNLAVLVPRFPKGLLLIYYSGVCFDINKLLIFSDKLGKSASVQWRNAKVETRLHSLLKEVTLNELEKEGYDLYVEPPDPPTTRMDLSCYRPDIFGISSSKKEFRFVLVECETNPQRSRIRSKVHKIRHFLTFQRRLDENCKTRLLLVIPWGKLRAINNADIRKLWEIWIVDYNGGIAHKIPRTARN